jgi:CubicO group peptidase (beta-lactamase class C family)
MTKDSLRPLSWPSLNEPSYPARMPKRARDLRQLSLAMLLLLVTGASAVPAQQLCPASATVTSTARWTREELCDLARDAVARHTDQLIVMERGQVVLEYRAPSSDSSIHIMSVTKSVAVLAVGFLLADGKLDSLDQPLSSVFPEWRQGRKRGITLRHLLAHTSGLQDEPNAGLEVEPARDVVQLALAAELSSAPGERFQYNNKAVNLISELVRRSTDTDLASYLNARLFRPLGIVDPRWIRDQAGNPYVMAGLFLSADQLARIGQLVLNEGNWRGQQLLPVPIARAMLAQQPGVGPSRGLLWWRFDGGAQANGWLGQWLVLHSESGTVAARLIKQTSHTSSNDDFSTFVQRVSAGAAAQPPTADPPPQTPESSHPD